MQIVEVFKDAGRSLLGLLGSTKEAYEGASRFGRIRVWILGAFGLDVLAVVLLVSLTGGRPLDLVVWFQPGFPSNMLVIRNEGGDVLENVLLVLDGKYRLRVGRLPPGLRGFEVNRDFRDDANVTPDEAYRPKLIRVEADGDDAVIPVESRGSP